MSKIYYVGDWAVQMGPVYAETPFNYAYKGLDLINYGQSLKAALESGGHEVKSVPTWEFYMLAPGEYEKVLAEYDVIVFSDVEAKNFQLAPAFFDRHKFGAQVLTFPDRVNLTIQAVHNGLHAMFLGGWLSFNGETGKAGGGRTRLGEILPVECLAIDDLRESTEGFFVQATASEHAICRKVDFSTMPPALGYNRTRPRAGCEVLAVWNGSDDPAPAVGRFGRGAPWLTRPIQLLIGAAISCFGTTMRTFGWQRWLGCWQKSSNRCRRAFPRLEKSRVRKPPSKANASFRQVPQTKPEARKDTRSLVLPGLPQRE